MNVALQYAHRRAARQARWRQSAERRDHGRTARPRAASCRPCAPSPRMRSGSARPPWPPPTAPCACGAWSRARAGAARGSCCVPRCCRAPVRPSWPPGARDLAEGNPDPAWLPDLRAALAPRPAARPASTAAPTFAARPARPSPPASSSRTTSPPHPSPSWAARWTASSACCRRTCGPAIASRSRTRATRACSTSWARWASSPSPSPSTTSGALPEALRVAPCAAGARAVVLTPRAQNPTGAALDEERARALRAVLDRHPDVLVIEDDHAGPVAGTPALTLAHARKRRWAVVRSVSKSLGPDLRLASWPATRPRSPACEGRQALGRGLGEPRAPGRGGRPLDEPRRRTGACRDAAQSYTRRRRALARGAGARTA